MKQRATEIIYICIETAKGNYVGVCDEKVTYFTAKVFPLKL